MITNFKYCPIIKTGDAELRALSQLSSSVKDKMHPIIELTRGRKSAKDSKGDINKRIRKLIDIFPYNDFFLDITSDEALSNEDIMSFHSSKNGYSSWCEQCIALKNSFSKFYPVVQIEEENDYSTYMTHLRAQVDCLLEHFEYIAFRSQDEKSAINIITDINNLIKLRQQENSDSSFLSRIVYILDYRYINDSTTGIATAKLFIEKLAQIGIFNIIISATSFPMSVSEVMSDKETKIVLPIKEISFFEKVKKESTNSKLNLIYSDYATANPLRNDNIVMARGWIPRIDVPYKRDIYISRIKRGTSDYLTKYHEVAEQIVNDDFFKNISNDIDCWGLTEIQRAAEGMVGGAAPSFWISVRINIHLNSITKLMLKQFS